MQSHHHNVGARQTLGALESRETGLTPAEAQKRLEQYGPNELTAEKGTTALKVFARQFQSFLVLILVFAAAVSALLGETTDAVVIFSIVVLNAILGFVQEFKAEKAMDALKKLAAPKARLLRDGRQVVIEAKEVVPGDVILFEAGDRVAADARLIEVLNLKIEEAVLTGESVPSVKFIEALPEDTSLADRENMAYMGTMATYGRGTGVVVATGMETEFGKIAKHIQVPEEPSPLQLKLKSLGVILGVVAIVAGAALFAIRILAGESIIESFMIAVALAVSAVPEGLLAVVTVALALGVNRMSKKNAIVRRLSRVETLGSVTMICSDKTGTLTKDEMTVKRAFVSGLSFEITGAGYEPKGEFLRDDVLVDPEKENGLSLLLKIGCLNNHATLEKGSEWSIIGDPTEGPLLTAAAKAGIWCEEVLNEYPMVTEIPFDSVRKRMTTIHELDGKRVAYVKGAPEILLELSSHILEDGRVGRLSQDEEDEVLSAVGDMAADALRVLGFAYRELPSGLALDSESVETDLVFVGVVGMIDPPRKEVKEAIATAKKAGIGVMMITGDHELTAQAIARDTGIMGKDDWVITGLEIDKMSDEELANSIEGVVVCARTSPEHKVRVLEALKTQGHIVAMTGDGVNDAPAIKGAHIGLSMGIKGTDVTREASDVVLADDNFATIVSAVEEGRGIYDNIRKFIRLMLSTNVDEILLVAATTLLGLPLPMLPMQVLWVNIVSDGLPALALSFDPHSKGIMQRKPRNPKEGIFHGMVLFIMAAALIDFVVEIILILYWKNTNFVDIARLRTIILTETVLFELFFVFNCRSETHSVFRLNPFENLYLVGAAVLTLLLQLAVIYVPFLQSLFETVPLTGSDWLIVMAISVTGLLVLPEVFMRRSGAKSATK